MPGNVESWTGRTVIYDPTCERDLDRLRFQYPRVGASVAGIEWALSNSPEQFPKLYGSSLRMAKGHAVHGVPRLRIWFTFDDSTATVLCVEPSGDEED